MFDRITSYLKTKIFIKFKHNSFFKNIFDLGKSFAKPFFLFVFSISASFTLNLSVKEAEHKTQKEENNGFPLYIEKLLIISRKIELRE